LNQLSIVSFGTLANFFVLS